MKVKESDLLRAMAHARVYLAAGDGLETALYALAHGHFGGVSRVMRRVLGKVEAGETAQEAIRLQSRKFKRDRDRGVASFLGILMGEEDEIDGRLEELTSELVEGQRNAIRAHTKRASRMLNMALIVMAFGLLPPIGYFIIPRASVLTGASPVLPPPSTCYLMLAPVLSAIFVAMGRRR